jgi:hypothetical protein
MAKAASLSTPPPKFRRFRGDLDTTVTHVRESRR